MKISPTEFFGENWERKKKKKEERKKERKGKNEAQMLCQGWATEKASSNQMGTGMLLRRRSSDAKLLVKYSVYSNYEIRYKNRDIY